VIEYVLRRLLVTAPVLLVVSFLVFAIVASFPGDPCREKLGQHVSPEALEGCHADLHLDDPFLERYGEFLGGAVRFDFGRDFRTNEPVATSIGETLPATIELTLFALAIATILGILVGTLSALKPGGWIDAVGQVLALGGTSIPVFWLGMMLIALFGVRLGWFPFLGWSPSTIGPGIDYRTSFLFFESLVRGEWAAVGRALSHLVLPATALSTIPLAVITRMTRSSVLEEVSKDYVTTARAKGLPERQVVGRHVLRNALVPIVTITGLQLGTLLSGAVLTETVFSWPGMGRRMVEATTQRNMPVVMASMLLFVVIFVLVNLVVDVCYHAIDPRIRQAAGR
jgi:peptide/nickel transport system permease protein